MAVVGGVPKNNTAAEQDFLNGFDEVNFHPDKKSGRDFVGEVSDGTEPFTKSKNYGRNRFFRISGSLDSKLPGKFASLHPSPKKSF